MPVLKIKSTHRESQGEFVLIDEENYDPKKHELYVEAPPEPVKDPDPANKPTKKSETK